MRAAHGSERRGTPFVCARECDVRQGLRVLVFPSGHSSLPDRLQGSVALLERRLDAARFRPEELGVCQACHGAHGEGMAAAHVPRIAGQSAGYLKKQLDNCADGTRNNPIMVNFAKPLSDKQRTDLAARFAAMSTPFVAQAHSVNAVTLARGHQLAFQGDEIERVQACNNCHGPDGVGVLFSAPYLAGRSAEYLASVIKAWHDGTRKNDAGQLTRSVAERLNDADIAAVAAFLASVGIAAR